MPRPLRIEYENAYYHVMNRGRARQKLFHGPAYYEAFLEILDQAHQRFGVEVLCYCLMDNHYHLLVKTPEANLGRIMRHINGVYTQRYNRMKKVDGALFRGRYKAICVEEDSYQLELSRYIHRNPLEAKKINSLDDFAWSSYACYVDKNQRPPKWLYQGDIYAQLGARTKKWEKYRAFVNKNEDDELSQYYGKGNVTPYLGSDEFRAWAYSQRVTDDDSVSLAASTAFRPNAIEIVEQVATAFRVSSESILSTTRGGNNNVPRWVAMHLCQEVGGLRLKSIAENLGLKRTGSIPTTIKKLKELMKNDKALDRKVERISRRLG